MDIRHYINLILRRSWLILLGALVAGATAFLISIYTTPVYSASTRLLIDNPPGDSANEYNQVLLEQRLAQTYVEIITMRSVLNETIERLGLPYSPSQLEELVTVSTLRDTQIIDVSVEDTDPQRAATTANTIADVFTAQNRERESLRYAEPIANWESLLSGIGSEIEDLETEISGQDEPATSEEQATLSQLNAQLREAQARYGDAVNHINELLVEQAKRSSNIVQLEAARPDRLAVRPNVLTNSILAAIVGAMVALGIVFLLDYLDDTIKDPTQIQEYTNLSTLGSMAMIKGIDSPGKLVTYSRPRDSASEAYRTLRTNLSYAAINGGLHSVLVTSPAPREGKSTIIANLGIVFAQSGIRVIIVDADLRRPVQHQFFSLPNSSGLTAAILNQKPPASDYLQETPINGLRVLTSGPIPPNPADLLGSQRMGDVLKNLYDEADLILVDTPPGISVTDAIILAPKMSGCLVVVKAGSTKRDALAQLVNTLETSGAHVYGTAFNMVRPGRGYRAPYYYYYQDKEYSADSTPAAQDLATQKDS